ncbi:hypothetical protein GCM10007897_05290 [Sphingobium jiangsuense]|uniref:Flp pilus assembly protein TadG n=1 Tax=Sphingobium jiangsuense TaxID=870476 RepID=A0A7W6BNT5_9SPHN|nr:TadE/TadG family type IV pilus assembly protein [Sphingobium jiangsuense]MBB3925104.1 Flp pilus assembly protein TadG [Sphingobium jiangsuense]GLS99150.1 hypothetical protein GCM10007897_05290 [Sphingobium jiangsuense]
MVARAFHGRLRADERGAALIEFAAVAPVLLLLLMGVFDIGHRLYIQSVLDGEMQRAGRSSTLESAAIATKQAVIDQRVRSQVLNVGTGGTVHFTRRAFRSYDQVQAAEEPYIDANDNGVCDNGETYDDWNGNHVQDEDGARNSQGNARDVVVYTAHVSVPRLFPMAPLLGWPATMEVQSRTTLRNQPFADQPASVLRTCP